jgi:hypothetical protein
MLPEDEEYMSILYESGEAEFVEIKYREFIYTVSGPAIGRSLRE